MTTNQIHSKLDSMIHHIAFDEFRSDSSKEQSQIIPDGMTELVFLMDSSYRRSRSDENEYTKISGAHIIGLKTRSCRVEVTEGVQAINVRFSPGALSFFTSEKLNEITDKVVVASDVFGQSIDLLADELKMEKDQERQKVLIKSYLANRYKDNRARMEVRSCLQEFYRYRGKVNISEFIKNLSEYKRIERYFTAFLGTSPKKMQQIILFNFAASLTWNNREQNLTQVAYDAGYYDQAHFIRSFKKFAGMSPSTFRKQNSTMTTRNQSVIDGMFS